MQQSTAPANVKKSAPEASVRSVASNKFQFNIAIVLTAALILILALQGATLWVWPVAVLLAGVLIVGAALNHDSMRIYQMQLAAIRQDRAVKQVQIAERESTIKLLRRDLEERSEKTASINEMLIGMLNKSDRELEDVGSFQQSLLPKKVPAFSGYHFAPLYQPSGWASGDYYDFIEINGSALGVVLADVSGHGGRASVIMAVIRALMQIYARSSMTPAKILRRINTLMTQLIPTEDFVTVFYMIIDREKHQAIYASAGQPYAILLRESSGEMRVLDDANGIPIKLFEDFEYEEKTISLEPGDRIILFTDGVIEAQNPAGELYQQQRLLEICGNSRDWPIQQQVELIQHKVSEYVEQNSLADDFTLLAIERESLSKIYLLPEQMEDDLLGLDEDVQVEDMKLTDLPTF